MSKKRKRRRYRVEEKLRILEEARQPNTTVAEVLRLGTQKRWTAAKKREALAVVQVTRERTGWTVRRILKRLGFPKSRYYDWKRRQEERLLDDRVPAARRSPHAILPEEKEAVIGYALAHPRDGYRRLAWRMVDEDVAYGSPFTAKDFKALVRDFELEHIRIRTYHPESNGKLERFQRSTREELAEQELVNLGRAREIIGRWVEFYNGSRLHASLKYLPPVEYWEGDPEARIEERKEKLEGARKHRERVNRARLQEAA